MLVLRPGHAPEHEAEDGLDAEGVVFTDWATATRDHAEILEQYAGTVVPAEDGKWWAKAESL